MTKLVFSPPGPDSPGYLKRVRQALVFSKNISSDKPSPEMIDEMVEFLSQYVTEPEAQAEKVAALWLASEKEFTLLLRSITGDSEGGDNPTSAARLNAEK